MVLGRGVGCPACGVVFVLGSVTPGIGKIYASISSRAIYLSRKDQDVLIFVMRKRSPQTMFARCGQTDLWSYSTVKILSYYLN